MLYKYLLNVGLNSLLSSFKNQVYWKQIFIGQTFVLVLYLIKFVFLTYTVHFQRYSTSIRDQLLSPDVCNFKLIYLCGLV